MKSSTKGTRCSMRRTAPPGRFPVDIGLREHYIQEDIPPTALSLRLSHTEIFLGNDHARYAAAAVRWHQASRPSVHRWPVGEAFDRQQDRRDLSQYRRDDHQYR